MFVIVIKYFTINWAEAAKQAGLDRGDGMSWVGGCKKGPTVRKTNEVVRTAGQRFAFGGTGSDLPTGRA